MHFKPSRLEARAALNGDHKLEARQLGIIQVTTADDDPFGWFTSLFGNGDPTTTTTRPRTTTTIGPVLPTVPAHTLSNAGATSRTPTTTTTLPAVVVTATPTPSPTPSPQFTTVTSTSSIDTGDTDTSQANVNGSTNNGLPSAVVGIIVAAAIIFGLIFIALVTRKVLQARRRNRRATWATTGITPFSAPFTEKALPPPPPAENREYPSTNYPAYPPAAAVGTTYNNTQPYSPAAPSSAAYPASYPFGVGSAPLQMQSTTNPALLTAADLAGPVVLPQVPATPTSAAAVAPAVSVVKRTFVPSLPDELSISNGEQVRVLSAYDDGWALCERVSNGQKGVVPQECLEMAKQPAVGAPTTIGSENSLLNRKSSLHRNAQ